jgi:hypothetical protein
MGRVNLTTGTFNLFVKDQNRGPPERRVFSRGASAEAVACPRNLFSLLLFVVATYGHFNYERRTFQIYRAQRTLSTEDFHNHERLARFQVGCF